MYVSVTVNLGYLDCTIATDTQQREEQLEAIFSPEVIVYSVNTQNVHGMICAVLIAFSRWLCCTV